MPPIKFSKPRPYQINDTIPTNIEECIEQMLKWGAIDQFKAMSESDAIASTHHSVGQYIRNQWGLWTGSPLKDYFTNKGLRHPDDMSGVIIMAFHRHLNGKPLNVDNEIKRIKKIQ
jgi:hypothetical protein